MFHATIRMHLLVVESSSSLCRSSCGSTTVATRASFVEGDHWRMLMLLFYHCRLLPHLARGSIDWSGILKGTPQREQEALV